MGWKDIVRLMLLASLWGASYLFIRIAVPQLGPFLLMDLRVLIGSGTLLLYAFILRRLPDLRRRWKQYLLLGTINSAIPFTLIAASELYIPSSLAAILNATTPMFTAVVAALWLKDPLTWKKGGGLLLGFIGVAVLVGWSPIPVEKTVLLSVAVMLAASFSYAVGGVYAKKAFPDAPPLTLAIGQLGGAAVAGWFLVPLGRVSLYVFIVHVFFVLAVGNVPGLDRTSWWQGFLVHTVVLALIWVMVKKKVLAKVIPA